MTQFKQSGFSIKVGRSPLSGGSDTCLWKTFTVSKGDTLLVYNDQVLMSYNETYQERAAKMIKRIKMGQLFQVRRDGL